MSQIPEHDKREQEEGLHPDVTAAYDYVDSVAHTADMTRERGHKAWHGWALREAFLAGMSAVDERARQLLEEIDKDERHHYPPADVFINAPLALIQMGLKGAEDALKKLLGRS